MDFELRLARLEAEFDAFRQRRDEEAAERAEEMRRGFAAAAQHRAAIERAMAALIAKLDAPDVLETLKAALERQGDGQDVR